MIDVSLLLVLLLLLYVACRLMVLLSFCLIEEGGMDGCVVSCFLFRVSFFATYGLSHKIQNNGPWRFILRCILCNGWVYLILVS
jgi:hypothetical protein